MSRSSIDAATLAAAGPDPLGVLASTAAVIAGLTEVHLDREVARRVAIRFVETSTAPPAWDDDLHFRAEGVKRVEQTIGWVVALDALNFCFWGQETDPARRWRVTTPSGEVDGYVALAVALRDAATDGMPLWDGDWLAALTLEDVEALLSPAPGSTPIPLIADRLANLRQLGANLPRTSATPWTDLLAGCDWSAPAIAAAVVARFPSFNDVAVWSPPGDGGEPVTVRFHKRAQILASDLGGALEAVGGPMVRDRDQLTAFADYKVPQVLRELGILRYDADLAETITKRTLIAPGSRLEVEIRAATIWGCEMLRQELDRAGFPATAADVDWLLWGIGQSLPATVEPYHRTVTMFY